MPLEKGDRVYKMHTEMVVIYPWKYKLNRVNVLTIKDFKSIAGRDCGIEGSRQSLSRGFSASCRPSPSKL